MFCKKCGSKNDDDAVFCSKCGTKLKLGSSNDTNLNVKSEDKSTRKVTYEGDLHKCPNCGEGLKSFEAVCPSCGHEMRSSKGSKALEDFSKALEVLETKRMNKSNGKAFMEAVAGSLGFGAIESVDKQVINLIRNFSVPNNIEDLYEFLILACSNINENIALADNYIDAGTNSQAELNSLRAINDAWMAKASQVYQKAFISSKDNSKFASIESIYFNKIKAVKIANTKRIKKKTLTIIVLILSIIALFAFLFFMAYLENQGII